MSAASSSSLLRPEPTQWRYRLHLYLDLGISPAITPALIAVLRASFPLSCVSHSSLSAEQHGPLTELCWEESRQQLNGLKVLDVLEQQWDIGGREVELGRRDQREAQQRHSADLSAPAPPARRLQTRKRRRRDGEEVDGAEVEKKAEPSSGHDEEAVELVEPFLPGPSRALQWPPSSRRTWGQLVEVVEDLSDDDVPLSAPPRPVFRLASLYERPGRRDCSGGAVGPAGAGEARWPSVYRYCSLTEYAQFANHSADRRTVDLSLLVTSFDCYVPGLTFVFGVARFFRAAVVSTHRLTLHSPAATSAFLHKECVHEVGHLFGLAHCAAPCVMTFSSQVEDAYAKDGHFCSSCKWKLGWTESGVTIKVVQQAEGEGREERRTTAVQRSRRMSAAEIRSIGAW